MHEYIAREREEIVAALAVSCETVLPTDREIASAFEEAVPSFVPGGWFPIKIKMIYV